MQNLGWATAQLYCKRKGDCIAIHCIVLQRSKLRRIKLSCNTLECIAIEVAGLGGNCIAIQFSGQQVCIAIQTVL